MIKILIGGSPCTFWSIAQKNNREVEAKGLGWELFRNYLIAKEKFQPDLFLYENNKSTVQAIKDQISRELGVDLMHINSALVSAQNRQRFYAFNWHVDQPEDRGIYLRDILEVSGEHAVGNEVDRRTCVAHPVKVGEIGNGGQGNRIYSVDGKAVAQTAQSGGVGSNTGLYAVPFNETKDGKSYALTASYYKASENPISQFGEEQRRPRVVQTWNGEDKPIYEVKDGQIETKGKFYPIKLPDGLYIIRKLTPVECERLQTMPDGYTSAVSNTQRYKGLGNDWTAEVIIHILTGALKDVPRDEEIVVLSMYDGIGTGRYCLDKMGFTNVTYYAYEIDKAAMKVALSNYPDIIQLGDAFDLRRDDWELGKKFDSKDADREITAKEEKADDDDQAGECSEAEAPTARSAVASDSEGGIREPTDPGGVRDLEEGTGESPNAADGNDKADGEGQTDGVDVNPILEWIKQTADEMLKGLIISDFETALEKCGIVPDDTLITKLKESPLEEVSKAAAGFPGYIITASLKKAQFSNGGEIR